MILQGSIDRLGNACIAAQAAARCLAELINTPGSALGTAMATYSSQNFGAGKRRRITQGLKMVLLICSVWWAVAMALTSTLGRSAVELITGSGDDAISIHQHPHDSAHGRSRHPAQYASGHLPSHLAPSVHPH